MDPRVQHCEMRNILKPFGHSIICGYDAAKKGWQSLHFTNYRDDVSYLQTSPDEETKRLHDTGTKDHKSWYYYRSLPMKSLLLREFETKACPITHLVGWHFTWNRWVEMLLNCQSTQRELRRLLIRGIMVNSKTNAGKSSSNIPYCSRRKKSISDLVRQNGVKVEDRETLTRPVPTFFQAIHS